MISSPIDEIKNRLDIVEVIKGYIKLQKAGANYRALCPFHSEKKPSFFVSPSRQIWHCFGCGEGGDIFKFVMKIEGLEFGDALRTLAQKAGVILKKEDPKLRTERQRLYEISGLACRFFEKQLELSSSGKEAKKYLCQRGLKEETIKKWHLGYAPDAWQGLSDFLVSQGYKREEVEKAGLALKSEKTGNHYDRFRARIIFPVFDLNSQVIGFGARVFKKDDSAKYVNTPNTLLYDKSRVLYGLNRAGAEIRKKDACVLVEGYLDVIMAIQAGYENVVATSGTALTPFQLRTLKRYSDNLLTAFDMDFAGDSATKRGIDLAQTQGFNIKIVLMPQGKDPADIVSQNPQQWESLVEKAKSIHDFYFENTLSRFDKNTLEGKKAISKVLLPVIKKIPNKIEQSVWLKDLATTLDVKEEDVLEELRKIILEKREEFIEQKNPLVKRTRKELLEERLAVLAIKCPENLNLIKQEDFVLFSPQVVEIINCLKENKQNEQINYLFLKAEVEPFDVSPEKEFQECFKELRALVVRDRLSDISSQIRKAEQEKNLEKVEQLIHQFHQGAKLLRES